MADHRLIAAYHDELLAWLPAELADEVCDGLTDVHERYVHRGLGPDQAAAAAIAEFGEARVVVDAFRRASPVWRLARSLIITGPVVGSCWLAALIIGRAWDWPIPIAVPLLAGLVLAASVCLLATATLTTRYRSVSRVGVTGCLGVAALDAAAIITAMSLGQGIGWFLGVAVCISTTRLVLVARTLGRYATVPDRWRRAR